jgi:hypothetical protein
MTMTVSGLGATIWVNVEPEVRTSRLVHRRPAHEALIGCDQVDPPRGS